MRKRWYSKSVCAVLTGAMVIGSLPASSLPAYAKESADTNTTEGSETTDSENSLITEIDFDGEKITASNDVEVKVEGTEKYSSDTRGGSGNAFDFNDSTYLDVSYENGDSLLSGHDELTIYYESKPDSGKSGNWSFFAANDDSAQTYNGEQYIGALDGTNGIRAERYLSKGERAGAVDCSLSNSDWKAVALVFDKDSYSVYADGEKLKTVENSIALTDILEDNSVLQIGKGNWGSGEYYDGLIDNIKIYGEALSDEEIAELSYIEKEPEVEKTAAEKLAEDVENLSIQDADDVRGNVYLPLTGDNGSEISWKSSDSSVVTDEEKDGKAAGVVDRGDEDKKVTMTASLSLDGETAEKEIELTVKAKADVDKDYSAGYLWAYFSVYEGYERMFLGYSEDGLNWESLNKDEDGTPQPILSNDGEGSDLGVRDPHIIRSPEG
ncbi:MAG: LamG domain-containing protein, partial [Lachnospiraceae bacterium]|nr:LamG domain-containing protein [Lachnospiraceae bacterium]